VQFLPLYNGKSLAIIVTMELRYTEIINDLYDECYKCFCTMNWRDLVDHNFKGKIMFDLELENKLEMRERGKRRPSLFKSLLSLDLYKRVSERGRDY